jgi:cytoplasmic iron level regulating protein YaaA (DUF328/UPF0246 family)
MLFILSPAKTLDFDTPVPEAVRQAATTPQFLARAAELIDLLKPHSARQIAALMDLSPALAELNVKRYAAWRPRASEQHARPALLAFDGDVYDGLAARSLGSDDLAWAQQRLAILSGLYGVLRPLDRIRAHRLEMGTALANPQGRDLYRFWGDSLAEHLNARVAAQRVPVIVNLASQEYFRAADRRCLRARVIECVFEDWKDDGYKIISFFAKRARGLMARHAIRARVESPERLTGFASDGYAYAAAVSQPDRLVFRRRLP